MLNHLYFDSEYRAFFHRILMETRGLSFFNEEKQHFSRIHRKTMFLKWIKLVHQITLKHYPSFESNPNEWDQIERSMGNFD